MLHGLGDHGGRFGSFARRLAESGWVSVAPDIPGHGCSAGSRGCRVRYSTLMKHIAAVRHQMAQRFPNVRQFLFGHSMGGNLAINYTIRSKEFDAAACPKVDGLILNAPMLMPAPSIRRDHVFAAWLAGRMVPWAKVSRPVEPEKLTGDRSRLEEIQSDQMTHSRVSLGFATELLAQGRFALDHAMNLEIPTRIDCGESDSLVSQSACRHLAIRLGKHAIYRGWKDQRHDLLRDIAADRLVEEIIDWLNVSCSQSARESNLARRRAA